MRPWTPFDHFTLVIMSPRGSRSRPSSHSSSSTLNIPSADGIYRATYSEIAHTDIDRVIDSSTKHTFILISGLIAVLLILATTYIY